MSDYTFRFGTYGSNNPLVYSEKQDGSYYETSHSWDSAIVPNAVVETSGLNGLGLGDVQKLFKSPDNEYILRVKSRGPEPKTFKINFNSCNFNNYIRMHHVEMSMVCEVSPSTNTVTGEPMDVFLSADMEAAVGYQLPSGSIDELVLTHSQPLSESKYANVFRIPLNHEFVTNNTVKYFRFSIILKSENLTDWATTPQITIKGFNIKSYEEIAPPVDENKYAIAEDEDGKKHNLYLCPWELKHVDSISIGVAGNTTTMGLPGHPASRTQIFDSAGAVRTFKISGRRYDWEEEISNWDFLNTQYNFAKDRIAGSSPDPDGYYCYIGLSWLLSNIQVLLKGYYLYIGRNEDGDHRFIGFKPNQQMPQGKTRGYNVALTGLNTSFSESEPGLLNYTITLTERFKYGDALYKPYNPELVSEGS